MSQSGVYGTPSPVPTTFNCDTGVAVPAANILIVAGGPNIETVGAGNTLTINMAGGAEGTGQTIGAVTDDIITFALGAAPGVYSMSVRIAAFEATTPAGAGYRINAAVRTTGAAGTLIGVNAIDTFEEAALAGCSVQVLIVGNDAIIRVTGVAGLTVDWSAEMDSIFQG